MASSSHKLTAILDLKDKLTSKLRKARKETDTFRDANGRLRNSLGQYVQETRRASSFFSRFTRDGVAGSNRLRSAFSRFTRDSTTGMNQLRSSSNLLNFNLGGIIATLTSAIGLSKLFKSTLGQAMEFEMAEATITAMFRGDTKSADKYIEMISKRALDSPLFNEQDYFQNSKSFLAMSKDVGELDNMWNIAERMAAMDPYQGLEGAVFAMRELFSGDAISMVKRFEMPRKVMNNIKNLPIAEQLKELDKLLSTMGFGNDFLEQISDTGLSYKNQIFERMAKALREIGTVGLESMKPQMKEFIEMMQTPAFDEFKEKIGESFGKAMGMATKFVVYIVKNWGQILPILKAVGAGFTALFALSKLSTLVTVIGALFNPITLIAGAVALLYYAFDQNLYGIKDKAIEVFNFLSPYFSKAFETMKTLFDNFMQFLSGDKMSNVFETIKSVAKTGWDFIKNVFAEVSPVIVGIVQQAWPVIQQIVQKVMDNVVPFLQSAWTIIKGIFETVAPIVIDLVKIAWDYIKQIIEFVMPYVLEIISTTWNTVIDAFMTVWNYIAKVMPMIQKIITFVWEVLKPIVVNAVWFLWEEIKNAFELIWIVVSTVFKAVWKFIESAWIIISGLFETALKLLTGDWKGAWETLKETAFGAWDKLEEGFMILVNGAWELGKKFIQNIIDGLTNMTKALVDTAKGIWDAVTGVFSKKQEITVGVSKELDDSVPSYAQKFNRRNTSFGHSGGLDYVPYDGYKAILHRGERVQTREENTARKPSKSGAGASLHIAKLADQIIIREEADIDKLTDKIADVILEAGGQGA